jgi:hypothetical protein
MNKNSKRCLAYSIVIIFVIELLNFKKSGSINILDLYVVSPFALILFLNFLTRKINIGLAIRIIINCLIFFTYFSISGILEESTVDWTSYIIYLVLSLVFGVIYGLISFGVVKRG